MSVRETVANAVRSKFGTQFADKMVIANFRNGAWDDFKIQAFQDLPMSPATHVLHYGSSCFEGLKIHRQLDGGDRVFRLDRHIQRLQTSAQLLCLPVPDANQVQQMLAALVEECRDWIPDHPGALYVRPTLLGTLPSIGAAASPSTEAMFFIIISPVGDYFSGGLRPLKLKLDDQNFRTSPAMGMVKCGGNYAMALSHIQKAREEFGVDQVLFAPGGDVQETGAANFFMINAREVRTKKLDTSFLHGVTRSSLLTLAADLGYKVTEDNITVNELLEWLPKGEAALSGTAAVLAPVGEFVYNSKSYQVGDGGIGEHTTRLRNGLLAIQNGSAEDKYGWMTRI